MARTPKTPVQETEAVQEEIVETEQFEQNWEPAVENTVEETIEPVQEVEPIQETETVQNVENAKSLNDIKKIRLTCDVMYNWKKLTKWTVLELDKEEIKKFPASFFVSNCD